MPKYPVTMQAVYDDSTTPPTITISGQSPAPPPPQGVPAELWTSMSGPGFEVVFPVKARAATVAGAVYVVPGSDPLERRRVEHRNGAWQMPGVVVTDVT